MRVALTTPTKEEHDYSTGNLVKNFISLCHDPLHDLQSWMGEGKRERGNPDRLLARPRASLVPNRGVQQVRGEARTQTRSRLSLPKIFRHAAKIATARAGDFNRSLMPFLSRVARAVIRDAAQQTTQHPQAEPEPCSYEAEVAAIVGRYGAAIRAVKRLNMPKEQIAAIIWGLMQQQSGEIHAVQMRRKAKAADIPPKP